jgi:hypothetical protein
MLNKRPSLLPRLPAHRPSHLIAVSLWLDQAYGPRAAYGLFQQVADDLVPPELHDA